MLFNFILITIVRYLHVAGKPDPVTNLQIESLSYREVIVSFTPGTSGGMKQNITCEYRNLNNNEFQTGGSGQYPMDYVGTGELTVASNLLPDTRYLITLVSDNDVTTGNPAISDGLFVTTKGMHNKIDTWIYVYKSVCFDISYCKKCSLVSAIIAQ